jgi:hypothetical protein
MYHVFESLPSKYQWIALVGLLIATLCVWLILSCQDAALPPTSAPNSTLSLQFAWSSEGAKAIIDSWTAQQKKIASYQLYIDFLISFFLSSIAEPVMCVGSQVCFSSSCGSWYCIVMDSPSGRTT